MTNTKITDQVVSIISAVSRDGDKALEMYSFKFDGLKIKANEFKIKRSRVESPFKNLNPLLKETIKKAAKNVKVFHLKELQKLPRSWSIKQKGSRVGQNYKPLETVGLYIPGGRYPYLSTILMTAIPAKIAGVKNIILATPPKNITDEFLFTANLCGAKDIYQLGGAQAIAAMALGTKTVPKVDFICGPGNAYVNEAKRQLFGKVGIDSLAGPSEVVILADRSANFEFMANDLLAQAEHDTKAKAYLFTDSDLLLKHVRGYIQKKYTGQIQLIKCSLDKAIEKINEIAPEHLEIAVKNPKNVISRINNAGAVFEGSYTPTAVGDYWAGPSHVLPTGGTARFSSGLSVLTFLKRTSFISYSKNKIKSDSKYIARLAQAEGFLNHKNSIMVRS
ncbi:MAG: histidinol dehydrogenase [Elusimicrobia bacterium]|nr:histidinol dehydrogenase [Candidatus Liberimonas magnetica]